MDDSQPTAPDSAEPDTQDQASNGSAGFGGSTAPAAPAPAGEPLDPDGLQVPDDPAELSGLRSVPAWQPPQYGQLIHSAGAEKLASSAVAPLVASAHDYRTIDADNLRRIIPELGIADMRSKPAKLVSACVGDRDALLMRWHSPASVMQAWRDTPGEFPPTDSVQLRPHPRTTVLNKKNERMKYAVLTGSESVMAIHPATPASWLLAPAGHLITEGLLKADSALSGLLADAGVPEKELAYVGANPEEALVRLHDLMEDVPQEKRIVIIALVGVGNWHQNPEWNAFKLKDRPLYLAFDGDINTNPNVYREAAKVWAMMSTRHADPRIIDLDVTLDDGAGGAVVEKVGIDDFLAAHGSYAELVGRRALDRLPERPTIKDPARKGEWRITPDGCWAEEYVEHRDDFGNVTGLRWESRVPLGGRILAMETRRAVTTAELETGFIQPDSEVNGAEHIIEFEISWRDEGGDTRTGRVVGSSDIAGEPPANWARRGAVLDPEVPAHPEFPPDKREWMRAVKAHRRDEIERRMTWMHMGWVPTAEGLPVFIVGDQVVGADGFTDTARPGVTERVLDGSSKFGVAIPKDAAEALAAIREVLDVYKATWTDPRIAAAAISVGLRAAVPHVYSSPILLSGVRRGGKSWTVATIASFWQSRPNLFSNKSLPGAVADTSAATEQAVSRALLWVVDDLAPTVDPRQAAQQEARLSDLLRAAHNRAAKRRSTADMQAREVLTPRAVLLVTAENALQISSVMDRVLHIRIPRNSIVTTEPHNRMREKTMTASMVAGACVVNEARRVRAEGWSATLRFWEARYEEAEEEAKEILEETARKLKHAIPGGVERHIQMAADLSLGLACLESAAAEAGADISMLREIAAMRDGLFSLIADGFWAQQETTPGHQLLRALRSVLAAGQAHIYAPGLPGAPIPATDAIHGTNASMINQQLGWQLTGDPTNPARALGRPIGQLVVHSSGRHVVLFDPQSAFAEARRAYPDLIPPGSGQAAAWSSLWDDGIAEALWRREKDPRSKLERNTVRPYDSSTGQTLPSAVPVPLDALLGTSTVDEFESEEEDAGGTEAIDGD